MYDLLRTINSPTDLRRLNRPTLHSFTPEGMAGANGIGLTVRPLRVELETVG